MSEVKPVEIWPPGTGILDLPDTWSDIQVPELRKVEREWHDRRLAAQGTPGLITFTERLHREWAIETGIIENLYDIERGVTTVLIEQGFSAAVMEHGSVNRTPEYILSLLNDQKDALEVVRLCYAAPPPNNWLYQGVACRNDSESKQCYGNRSRGASIRGPDAARSVETAAQLSNP
jgi:hypothetical protein